MESRADYRLCCEEVAIWRSQSVRARSRKIPTNTSSSLLQCCHFADGGKSILFSKIPWKLSTCTWQCVPGGHFCRLGTRLDSWLCTAVYRTVVILNSVIGVGSQVFWVWRIMSMIIHVWQTLESLHLHHYWGWQLFCTAVCRTVVILNNVVGVGFQVFAIHG